MEVHNMEAFREEWVNSQINKARIVRNAIVQSPHWFLELTNSSSNASIYELNLLRNEATYGYNYTVVLAKSDKNLITGI